jgi:hypothetical protein
MKPTPILPQGKYYLASIVLGSMLNILLLIVIVIYFFGFGGKSAAALMYMSVTGYFFKSIIFFLPFFYLNSDFISRYQRNFIIFSPFLLYIIWFCFIIIFEIESLSQEISYGYTDRFPHFYLQLLSTLLICLLIRQRVNRRYRQEEGDIND